MSIRQIIQYPNSFSSSFKLVEKYIYLPTDRVDRFHYKIKHPVLSYEDDSVNYSYKTTWFFILRLWAVTK